MYPNPNTAYPLAEIEYRQERIARDWARAAGQARRVARHHRRSRRLEVVAPYGDVRA